MTVNLKVDLNFKIKKLDGTDFIDLEPDGVGENGQAKFKESKPMTLRKAIVDSLTSNYQDEQKLEASKKAERGWLAMKIHGHPDPLIELTVDEVKLCKDLIGKRYSPLVVALCWQILDPASEK